MFSRSFTALVALGVAMPATLSPVSAQSAAELTGPQAPVAQAPAPAAAAPVLGADWSRKDAASSALCRGHRLGRARPGRLQCPDALRAAIDCEDEGAQPGRDGDLPQGSPPISSSATSATAAGSTGTSRTTLERLRPAGPARPSGRRADVAETLRRRCFRPIRNMRPEGAARQHVDRAPSPRPDPHQPRALALAAAQPRRPLRDRQRARLHRRPGRQRPASSPATGPWSARDQDADPAAQRDDHRRHLQSLVERAAEHHSRGARPAAAMSRSAQWRQAISVRQPPGPRNALGRVKIGDAEPYAIYLHDTPSQALFERPVRAFSHGCIRTQNAATSPSPARRDRLGPAGSTDRSPPARPTQAIWPRRCPSTSPISPRPRPTTAAVTYDDIYGRDGKVLAA